MTADTEFQRIGRLHGGIETTPKNYAAGKKYQRTADGCTKQNAARKKTGFFTVTVNHKMTLFQDRYSPMVKCYPKPKLLPLQGQQLEKQVAGVTGHLSELPDTNQYQVT
jgi:hypothetical protein